MHHALPEAFQGVVKRRVVLFTALRKTLAELSSMDWLDARERQQREFERSLEPMIQQCAGYRLQYFGLAPIPLAMHLGYLVGGMVELDAYQLHHDRKDWSWPPANAKPLELLDCKLPQDNSLGQGDVIIRVSVSHHIDRQETLEVVPRPLHEIDIALAHPDEDALQTPADLDAVIQQFNRALDAVRRHLPNTERIHLFASVPVGLAFRLGTCVNPTIHASVQTYQYFARESPRHKEAFILQADSAPSIPLTSEDIATARAMRQRAATEHQFLQTYGEHLHPPSKEPQAPPRRWWQAILETGSDLQFQGRLAGLAPLYNTGLMKWQVDVEKTAVADSFCLQEGRWEFGDELLVVIGRRLSETRQQDRAIRMLLLHEAIHRKSHSLTTATGTMMRRFPKVLEEIDYQADVWAMLHEYGFTRWDPRQAGGRTDCDDVPRFFRSLIDTALATFWSFDDRGVPISRMELRRINRYLIWYWQRLRLDDCASLKDVLDALAERPILEIAGPSTRIENGRVVYLLDQHPSDEAELCVLEGNRLSRIGHSEGTRVRDVLHGFRDRDSAKIRFALKSVFDQVRPR